LWRAQQVKTFPKIGCLSHGSASLGPMAYHDETARAWLNHIEYQFAEGAAGKFEQLVMWGPSWSTWSKCFGFIARLLNETRLSSTFETRAVLVFGKAVTMEYGRILALPTRHRGSSAPSNVAFAPAA